MMTWEYLWRKTHWAEEGRSGDYVKWVTYSHVWKPDRETVELFPNDHGFDDLGKAGWELVAMTPEMVSLLTRQSPQGDTYSQFQTYLLMFKRPLG
jgi:hypothetical protein